MKKQERQKLRLITTVIENQEVIFRASLCMIEENRMIFQPGSKKKN